MIINNLWIIAKIGTCYYHFNAPFSDYQIDEVLFSGFIAGFSYFADFLSQHKTIEYLKFSDDELYFETIGDIIVAAILSTSDTDDEEKLHPFSIKVMLQFVGNKFLELYSDTMEDLNYEWKEIQKPFTDEIQKFLLDRDFLEEIKREQFQSLFNKAISDQFPLDLLHWRGIQLFSNFSPEGLKESMKLLSNLSNVASTLIIDKILEAKVLRVLNRLEKDLKSTILEQEPQKLLIVCDSQEFFDNLSTILLASGVQSIFCPSFDYLKEAISTWGESNGLDILSISQKITPNIIRSLHELDLKHDTKIVVVVKKIPRPPRGRLIHRRSITYIIQEFGSIIDPKSPLIDYITTSLTA